MLFGEKFRKKILEIGASDCTKNFLFSTKRIIEKAFLEPKLLNLKACSSALTKLPHFHDNKLGGTGGGSAPLLNIIKSQDLAFKTSALSFYKYLKRQKKGSGYFRLYISYI